MTPLFAVPDTGGRDTGAPDPGPPPRRRAPRRPATGVRARRATAVSAGARVEPADLLAVTTERLRRALARSFLRYGVAGDPDAAVHAAMNVIEPVLQARDSEIVRLRQLMTGR
jgi:hypothetical protein